LLFNLREAVAASAGSACHAGSVSISPVLRAMAVDPAVAIGTVRFSTGKYTTEEEIDKAIGLIAEEVRRLKTEAPSVSK
jgi:cysteine desulfurase